MRKLDHDPDVPNSFQSPSTSWSARLSLPFAFVVGLSVTVVEFTAVRFFAPFFGQSNLVWTNIIGVVLLALACGYVLGGRIADRSSSATPLLVIVAVAGILIVSVSQVGPRLASALVPNGFPAGANLPISFFSSLIGSLVLFALPVMLLGGVGPYLIRLSSVRGREGSSSGLVFGVSTAGSILGCYLTTLWLIPRFGVRATLFATGYSLLTLAAVGFACDYRARRVHWMGSVAVAVVMGITGYASASVVNSRLRQSGLDGDKLLLEDESAYQTIRVLERKAFDPTQSKPATTRVLALDEGDAEYHSVTIPGRVDTGGRYFDTLALSPFLAGPEEGPYEVLIIGFAGGSLYRGLRHLLGDRLRATGVEIDPRVVFAAQRFLDLPSTAPGLELIYEDGRAYVNSLPASRMFDLVVIDAYADQAYIPFHLASSEFFARVRLHIAQGGVLAVNVDCREITGRLVRTIAATVENAGYPASWILPISDYPSAILFARPDSPRPLRMSGSIPYPWRRIAFNIPRMIFGYVRRPGDIVLKDDHAPIEQIIDGTLP